MPKYSAYNIQLEAMVKQLEEQAQEDLVNILVLKSENRHLQEENGKLFQENMNLEKRVHFASEKYDLIKLAMTEDENVETEMLRREIRQLKLDLDNASKEIKV